MFDDGLYHHSFFTLGRSGFLASLRVCSSKVSIPPKAVPTMTPIFSGFSNVSEVSPSFASLRACLAAATAKWVKRSLVLMFLGLLKKSAGSKISSGTSLAIWHGMYCASNRFTVSTLDFPSRQASKKASWPTPHPLTTPSPVTTTRTASPSALAASSVDADRTGDLEVVENPHVEALWLARHISKRLLESFIFDV